MSLCENEVDDPKLIPFDKNRITGDRIFAGDTKYQSYFQYLVPENGAFLRPYKDFCKQYIVPASYTKVYCTELLRVVCRCQFIL